MNTIAIWGAGELGAALARRLADHERARCVYLVDADVKRARGKALDILQGCPVEGSDTRVEGASNLAECGPCDVVVLADPGGDETGATPAELAAVAPSLGQAVLLVAVARPVPLVAAAVGCGRARERVVASVPLAWAARLQRLAARELNVSSAAVGVSVMGLPPDDLFIPHGGLLLGGSNTDEHSPTLRRRLLAAAGRRGLGPVALAAAAERVLRALAAPRADVLSLGVWLDGEYGQRRILLAVPTRIGDGVVKPALEAPLAPVDRVALAAAADRAAAAGATPARG